MGQEPDTNDCDVLSPKEDEQKIACLMEGFDLVIDRCEYTACHTSRTTLCWLASSRAHRFQDRPFSLVSKKSSEKKYRHLQKRLLAFVFRLSRMWRAAREKEIGKRISSTLLAQLRCIWDHKAWELFD
jgi:hypothetical protein